ncbi:MAG: hypothetical protein WA771_04875 [Chthoniobacterales bacterium]
MSATFDRYRREHPAVVDACVWAISAIVIGLVLRVLLTVLQPYAYYGSDSDSYFSFTFRLLTEGVASIPEKRRYVYPLLVLPSGLLPGSALRWLPVFQHGFGLLTLIPLAYVVRKVFVKWRWWVVPITVAYAATPIVIWYEHELLGEAFFFASFIWAFAAWVAWCYRIESARRWEWVWWSFFVAFGLCALTKPAGRFFWPGLIIGLISVKAWRMLRWWHWAALVGLLVMSWTLGKGSQASRLLYTSALPLTRLDTSSHAELKAEIEPLVKAARKNLDRYYLNDDAAKDFLRGGYRSAEYPAWRKLRQAPGDPEYDVMRDLALEGIFSAPHLFIYIALQRTVGSMNWAVFKEERFEPEYFPRKFENRYEDLIEEPKQARILLGLPEGEPLPSYEEIRSKLLSGQNETLQSWQTAWVNAAISIGKFVEHPTQDGIRRTLGQMTPTWQGWILIAGVICSLAAKRFRTTLGVWVLIAGGHAVGVHLVGSCNPRFFALTWPIVFVVMAAPLDWIAGRWAGPRSKS